MPVVPARTEIIVVRHEKEAWKSTGTARIAALALPSLKLLDYTEDAEPAKSQLPEFVDGAVLLFPGVGGAPAPGEAGGGQEGGRVYTEDAEPAKSQLPEFVDGAALLFPGGNGVPSPCEGGGGQEGGRVRRLIVLDGTWRQTRKMYAKLNSLHAVPKLELPPPPLGEKVLRLRDSTFAAGRSTLEAIAEALTLLEGPAIAAPLHALHTLYVERVFRARGVWELKRGV